MPFARSVAPVVRHTAGAAAEALLIAAVGVALVASLLAVTGFTAGAGTALGAGGRAATSGSSISVADGPFGGVTTAYVKGGASWVHVVCATSSGSQMVAWEQLVGGQADIVLGPTASWRSGTASCRADAGHFDSRSRFKVDASTTFKVY